MTERGRGIPPHSACPLATASASRSTSLTALRRLPLLCRGMTRDLEQGMAAFAFPYGVRPELLERTPSMSGGCGCRGWAGDGIVGQEKC